MNYLTIGITYILYVSFLCGIFLLFSNAFINILARLSLRYRLYDQRHDNKELIIFSYFSRVIYVLYGKEKKGKIVFLILVSIFSISFSFAFIYFRFLISILLAFLCTSIPILSLVSKLSKERSRSSKEGQRFISEIYRNYRIVNKNIFAALEKTVEEKESFPFCAKHAYMLLLKIRSSGSKKDIKRYCNDFSYSIGSVWAKSLSICIYYACDGVDVSDALIDLIATLKISRENYEIRKRLNAESLRMTIYLVPVLFVGSYFAGQRYLGITITKMLYNQFTTPEGLFFLFAIVLLFAFNILSQNFICDKKIDI